MPTSRDESRSFRYCIAQIQLHLCAVHWERHGPTLSVVIFWRCPSSAISGLKLTTCKTEAVIELADAVHNESHKQYLPMINQEEVLRYKGRRTVEHTGDNYRPPWRTFLQTCCRSVAVTQNIRPPRSLMMHQRAFRSCYKCVAVTSLKTSGNGSDANRISGCCTISSFSGER